MIIRPSYLLNSDRSRDSVRIVSGRSRHISVHGNRGQLFSLWDDKRVAMRKLFPALPVITIDLIKENKPINDGSFAVKDLEPVKRFKEKEIIRRLRYMPHNKVVYDFSYFYHMVKQIDPKYNPDLITDFMHITYKNLEEDLNLNFYQSKTNKCFVCFPNLKMP